MAHSQPKNGTVFSAEDLEKVLNATRDVAGRASAEQRLQISEMLSGFIVGH